MQELLNRVEQRHLSPPTRRLASVVSISGFKNWRGTKRRNPMTRFSLVHDARVRLSRLRFPIERDSSLNRSLVVTARGMVDSFFIGSESYRLLQSLLSKTKHRGFLPLCCLQETAYSLICLLSSPRVQYLKHFHSSWLLHPQIYLLLTFYRFWCQLHPQIYSSPYANTCVNYICTQIYSL